MSSLAATTVPSGASTCTTEARTVPATTASNARRASLPGGPKPAGGITTAISPTRAETVDSMLATSERCVNTTSTPPATNMASATTNVAANADRARTPQCRRHHLATRATFAENPRPHDAHGVMGTGGMTPVEPRSVKLRIA